ncbi:uncharacterized protein LOC144712386 [Wolffia australiana]
MTTRMKSCCGKRDRPKAEDVISKLKDDGDFDSLRLKIVRKIKENEDLRSQIISEVKKSAALDREGAENLKPRQLLDAIHEEIGAKLMGFICDELWNVIRSGDGMRDEIRNSVRSVCYKLMNPELENMKSPFTVKGQPSAIPADTPTCLPRGDVLATTPGFVSSRHMLAEHVDVAAERRHKDEEADPDVPPGFG